MTPQLAKKWIKRLKNPISKKKKGMLSQGKMPTPKTPMCCLGHLVEMQGDWEEGYAGESYLPAGLSDKYGVDLKVQRDLASLNDESVGFKAVIEKIHELYIGPKYPHKPEV